MPSDTDDDPPTSRAIADGWATGWSGSRVSGSCILNIHLLDGVFGCPPTWQLTIGWSNGSQLRWPDLAAGKLTVATDGCGSNAVIEFYVIITRVRKKPAPLPCITTALATDGLSGPCPVLVYTMPCPYLPRTR
jgi:hypothetical protein